MDADDSDPDPAPREATPWDWLLLATSVGAAVILVALHAWVEVERAAGGFRDQGGMFITFCVCPVDLLLWPVAGPLALLGRRGEAPPPWPVRARRVLGWSLTLALPLGLLATAVGQALGWGG